MYPAGTKRAPAGRLPEPVSQTSAVYGQRHCETPLLLQVRTCSRLRSAGGTTRAEEAYALAYRAVTDLGELGGSVGLAPLFANWRRTRSLERAVRATYGITLTEFEQRWRDRTRRRYGGLALMGSLAIAGVIIGFLVLPLYLARRRRDRRRFQALVVANQVAEAAAARNPIADLLGETPQGGDKGSSANSPP